ncbi:DNA-directed RNA polymerase subunit beta' [Candidatus Roizmanbacteria bacterium RIFCSPHIGHO2_01_FULL_39_12b]|uniref:DNA-directed RNA polymerase subunit beta' n=1 Tax=Candidatus Roizmanbacteria bacterium RIFCSPHIGHO2_01_FULL_39_12b TaxID=1802030 RepID=A0A1F7GC90_9BACT|nr:MAG: DNA-directed RNA polymerase subunit beta' [Candidatus Roizmanbacteria bacterium RIFCSPHIGHO2_01_FULL_39_12b]OGK47123.1 MAG: DNA-directed RNA polymerase subunit beta' [Candidatus Roizmanbacteria bacterium RIFCSPLOWO2_01_FULL_39_19]
MEESQSKKSNIVRMVDFSGIKLMLASPEIITSWSYGEVTKPETINYRTFKPEKDGLFDERIFGPTKDYECYCGKYKRMRYKGIVCDRCGVEVTTSVVRRERMGHIKLASPVAHIWYFKGASSPLSVLLNITSNNLERIVYYALYLIKHIDEDKRVEAVKKLDEKARAEIDIVEVWNKAQKDLIGEEEKKAKQDIIGKVKNKEQAELTIAEAKFKFRERYTSLGQRYNERKTEKQVFFERLNKLVKSIGSLETIEEEDHLYLSDIGASDFLTVGMGSEVLLETLGSIDLKKEYQEVLKKLVKQKGEKRTKMLKKARLVESFIKSGVAPRWMVMVVLPVIPPDLRPVVQLSGGKFATSDLNDFYRRVINRNNRLKHLIELGAPEIILRNEKRMLQEAVDSLIDLSKSRGGKAKTTRTKQLKSLSEVLKGKQGRFRQNLLGKRVDYSGRSVIIGGPELKLHQCGLPKEMALELFKPFLLHEVIIRGLAQNIRSAKNFLETKDPIIYDILEEITSQHPVMLNRAPTLHKLSILGFYPVLTDDHAIKLHPTVCQGYNADFDGDQMAVFVPLSAKSIEEVKTRMLPQKNLLKPADGSPIVVPNKDMALGCYYITTINHDYYDKEDKELKHFASDVEAKMAFDLGFIETRQPIIARINNELLRTSIGRILFNDRLPEVLRFINQPVTAGDLKKIIVSATIKFVDNEERVAQLIDDLKELGFWGSTISGGLSLSIFDCLIAEERDELLKIAEEKVKQIETNYLQGLITEDERKRLSNDVWLETTETMADRTWEKIEEENPIKIVMNSGGARASREQLKQLSAMKGLVIDPLGKIVEVPTKSNYRGGLSIFEYVISARGARKGLIDSALKTADAGYLTRRLVDVSHDMIVREHDCGVEEGLIVARDDERSDKFVDRAKNRFTLHDIIGKNKKVLFKKGELISEDKMHLLDEMQVERVEIRSALYCKTEYGCCQLCYGVDLATKEIVEIGTPVGITAAQSIGEPGTQLTMRVRHFGGIVMADVTQGLPRVEELFEARTPKIMSPITDIAGSVSVKENTEKDVYVIKITSSDKTKEEREFMLPTSRKLKVKDGQLVPVGYSLSEGFLDIQEILMVKGLREAQIYLLNEIQKVYESQGIPIHDKHFEVIIRKMSDKVVVESEGDTKFITGEVVSRYRFDKENKKVLAQGGRPAVGRVSILGVTRAATFSDSWLSASSFQNTTTILTQASIKGQVDNLLGLKENVIIGRLIPVTEELLDKYFGDSPKSELGTNEMLSSSVTDDVGATVVQPTLNEEEEIQKALDQSQVIAKE